MNQSPNNQGSSSLEHTLASELGALLKGAAVGAELAISPSAPVCYTLELFLPEKLRHRYAEWARESLDGFFIASAKKIGPAAVDLVGTCILIGDQTVTPFRAGFAISDAGDSISAHRVRVGEPGHGPLGISGPPCNSKAARRLLEGLIARLDSVRWVYDVNNLQLSTVSVLDGDSARGGHVC